MCLIHWQTGKLGMLPLNYTVADTLIKAAGLSLW